MEDLTEVIIATGKEFYAIEVRGYIEPTDDTAIMTIEDDRGTVYYKSMYNAHSGMFNAFAYFMLSGFDGVTVLSVKLENANWILDTIVKPSLSVRRVQ